MKKKQMNENKTEQINEGLKIFDKWTSQIGLPNEDKPLKDITAQEYKDSLYNFYLSLKLDMSFKQWILSFYSRNEIDYEYIDLMSWDNWIRLYVKVLSKYLQEGIVNIS